MSESDLEADFLLGWTALSEPEPPQSTGTGGASTKKGSRLTGESSDRRERRLRQARECSSQRRSMETTEQREKRLKDQRERMATKRRMEASETRVVRLERARERESLRRRNETPEGRERRLKYSRDKAALRRDQETSEQREYRLEASRLRAAQRRRERKEAVESVSSESSSSLSEQQLLSLSTESPAPESAVNKPREQRVTRQSIQEAAEYKTLHAEPNQLHEDVPVISNNNTVNLTEPTQPSAVTSGYFSGYHVPSSGSNNMGHMSGFHISGSSSSTMGHVSSSNNVEHMSGSHSNNCNNMGSMPMGRKDVQSETNSDLGHGRVGPPLTLPPPPPCQLPSGSCQNQGREGGGTLGGIGFLERRYDHPDFRYGVRIQQQQQQQRQVCGIQAVVVKNTFT